MSSEPAAEIRTFRIEDDAERDAYVNAHADGSFFHLSGWRKAVKDAFRHQPRDLLAWRDGRIVGCLPLMRCAKLGGGSHLISAPYGVYGGPIGDAREDVLALTEEAKRIAEELGVGRLELRCEKDLELGLEDSDLYVTYVTELPAEQDEVLARMPKRARAEVRKARDRHGLTLSEGHRYMDDLIRMFHTSKHALGSPGLPAKWYRALERHLGDNLVLHMAEREGEPLACLMSFIFRDTIMVYYIGVAPGANREYSATGFACAGIQQWAIEKGLRYYDLGRSRKDSGASKFKKNQGLEAAPLHYAYHLVKSEGKPSFNPSNPRTEILQKTWRKMPLWLARGLSSPIARYLP